MDTPHSADTEKTLSVLSVNTQYSTGDVEFENFTPLVQSYFPDSAMTPLEQILIDPSINKELAGYLTEAGGAFGQPLLLEETSFKIDEMLKTPIITIVNWSAFDEIFSKKSGSSRTALFLDVCMAWYSSIIYTLNQRGIDGLIFPIIDIVDTPGNPKLDNNKTNKFIEYPNTMPLQVVLRKWVMMMIIHGVLMLFRSRRNGLNMAAHKNILDALKSIANVIKYNEG